MDLDALKTNIKRFFLNPNTITFFLVIVMVVIVYVMYVMMINRAVNPTDVYYAADTLKSNTVITSENIDSFKVSGNFLSVVGREIKRNRNSIVGYQVAEGYQIPQFSFFYNDAIVNKDKTVENPFYNIPDGYTIYNLKVDFHKTYGNSILPGDYIDLFYYAKDDEDKIVFEKFITSIQVYKVYDSGFNDVFSTTDDENEANPAYLSFAVSDEIRELLEVANMIGVQMIPIPRNSAYSANPSDMKIYNVALQELIESRRYGISN